MTLISPSSIYVGNMPPIRRVGSKKWPLVSVSCHPTSEFIRVSRCSIKTMVASKDTRNYIGSGWSPMSSLRDSSSACSSVECSEVLIYNGVWKKRDRGWRVERDCPNEVSRVRPLGRVPRLPLYRVWGHVTYREIGSPDRVVVSLREGKLVILACKEGHLVLLSAYVRASHGLVPTS
jgi:hypothetical protein